MEELWEALGGVVLDEEACVKDYAAKEAVAGVHTFTDGAGLRFVSEHKIHATYSFIAACNAVVHVLFYLAPHSWRNCVRSDLGTPGHLWI